MQRTYGNNLLTFVVSLVMVLQSLLSPVQMAFAADATGGGSSVEGASGSASSAPIQIKATVDGSAPAAGQKFKFNIAKTAVSYNYSLPSNTTAETNGPDAVSFGAINYTENDYTLWKDGQHQSTHKVYYRITADEANLASGWSVDEKASSVTVTVTLDKDASGKIYAKNVDYSNNDCINFISGGDSGTTDPDTAEGPTAEIKVSSLLNGAAPAAGTQFSYTLTPEDSGNPMPSTATFQTDGGDEVSFGVISFANVSTDAGERYYKNYYYQIKCTSRPDGTGDSLSYIRVLVSFKSGKLDSVTYARFNTKGTAVDTTWGVANNTFSHHYIATADIQIKSTVNGADEVPENVSFTYYLASAYDDYMPEGTEASANNVYDRQKKVEATGSKPASFGTITYDKEGLYVYFICGEDGYTANGTGNDHADEIKSQNLTGWSDGDKDKGSIHLQAYVSVTKDTEGKLSAKVTYGHWSSEISGGYNESNSTEDGYYWNYSYTAPATAEIKVRSTVNGTNNVPSDVKFTYWLVANNESYMPEDGVTELTNSNWKKAKKIQTAGSDEASFGGITFDKKGTYLYYIVGEDAVTNKNHFSTDHTDEIKSQGLSQWWNDFHNDDDMSYLRAYVEVTASEDGKLSTSVEYKRYNSTTKQWETCSDDAWDFSYTGATNKASQNINVEATLNDKSSWSNDYTFDYDVYWLKADGTEHKVSSDTAGDEYNLQISGTGANAGKGVFKRTSFDAGSFTYVFKERKSIKGSTVDGMAYAPDTKVVIEAVDDYKGSTKIASVKYYDGTGDDAKVTYESSGPTTDGTLLFENLYKVSPVDVKLSVAKAIQGTVTAADKDKEFTFDLLDAQGTVLQSGLKVKAGSTATFNAINFATKDATSAKGSYTYTIRETSTADKGWTNAADVTVTVKVSVKGHEDGTAEYVADVSYGNAATDKASALFTNVYKPEPVKVAVGLSVPAAGEGAPADSKFGFELYKANDAGTRGDKVEGPVTVVAGQSASFRETEYTEPGTYKYLVHRSSADAGWPAVDDVEVYVVVEDEGGQLKATLKDANGNELQNLSFPTGTFTPAKATISVAKEITGLVTGGDAGKAFTFELEDAEGNAVSSAPLKVQAGKSDSFAELSFNKAGSYTYTVHETSEAGTGWTNAADVTATVTVAAKDDGALGATVAYSKANEAGTAALFTNVYKPLATTAAISVKKGVTGEDVPADAKFGFELYAAADDGARGDKIAGVEGISLAAGETASFAGIAYEAAGTYKYVVHETATAGAGWSYAADVNVTVTVADNGGQLKATLAYDVTDGNDSGAAYFLNSFTPAKASVKVAKAITGDAPKGGEEFEFALLGADKTEVAGAGTLTLKAGENGSFKAVAFNKVGTYTYYVHETSAAATGWMNGADAAVTVSVSAANEGSALEASVSYGEDADYATVTNAFAAAKADVKFTAKVTGANGVSNEGLKYTLQPMTVNGVTAPAQKNNEAIVGADGNVEFGQLAFNEAGAYYYSVQPDPENLPEGWDPESPVTVKVVVEEQDGKFVVKGLEYQDPATGEKIGDAQNPPTVESEFAPAKAVLGLETRTTGDAPAKAQEFEYSVKAGDGAPAPAQASASVEGEGTADFGQTEFTKSGSYVYTISDVSELAAGWTRAKDVTATVTVKLDKDTNALVASVEYSNATEDGERALFTSAFKAATGDVEFGTKVSGADGVSNEGLTYKLTPAKDKDGNLAPEQENGQATVGANGLVKFGGLSFNAPGEYFYTVEPDPENLPEGWDPDSPMTVKVTVGEDENGQLQVMGVEYLDPETGEKIGDNENPPTVETVFEAAKVALAVTKKVEGEEADASQKFEFALYRAKADGSRGDKVEGVKAISLKAGETKAFDEIELTEAGTFAYVIHETTELGEGWTAADDVKVTVKVVCDEESNALKATVEYGETKDSNKSAYFLNKYVKPAKGDTNGNGSNKGTTGGSTSGSGTTSGSGSGSSKGSGSSSGSAGSGTGSSTSGSSKSSGGLAKTGDSFDAALTAGVAALGALLLGGGYAINRRQRKQR